MAFQISLTIFTKFRYQVMRRERLNPLPLHYEKFQIQEQFERVSSFDYFHQMECF